MTEFRYPLAVRVLVTGGAGFVGSSLALYLKREHPDWGVTSFDNLKRRGSELGLSRLGKGGVRFVHGDVRLPTDLAAAGACDLIVECSAEPSVLAGLKGSPAYVLETNLGGTINCLELARQQNAGFVFLSTSRVYPIGALSGIPLQESPSRFELDLSRAETIPGLSVHGVAEDFPLSGARSMYGATKLASELLVEEYAESYAMPAVVNRCGVIAGPWQMGRIDQGIVMHWVSSHFFGWPLRYIGYGGMGKQVRDILHIEDLAALIGLQIASLQSLKGRTFNVGGGPRVSVSLLELTELCVRATGRRVSITSEPETRIADVPLYLSDSRRATEEFGWSPIRTAEDIVADCAEWLQAHEERLLPVFDPNGERGRS